MGNRNSKKKRDVVKEFAEEAKEDLRQGNIQKVLHEIDEAAIGDPELEAIANDFMKTSFNTLERVDSKRSIEEVSREWQDENCMEDGYFNHEERKLYEKRKTSISNDQLSKQPKINWQCGELLGQGACGKVYLGLNSDTGELMAIKQVSYAAADETFVRTIEAEVEILKNLRHDNMVRYLGMEKDESTKIISIFIEYVSGGSLASMLSKFGKFSENLIRIYTKQILMGLSHLHDHQIMHRDIKGANILVDNNGIIKLTDFGASKKMNDLATMTEGFKSLKGTPYWMAPEVIRQTGHGRQADIWSVACTIVEMATGKPPWSQFTSQVAALFHIASGKSAPPIPSHLSKDAQDFLRLCFQRDPKMRPNAHNLLKHPFIVNETTSESVPIIKVPDLPTDVSVGGDKKRSSPPTPSEVLGNRSRSSSPRGSSSGKTESPRSLTPSSHARMSLDMSTLSLPYNAAPIVSPAASSPQSSKPQRANPVRRSMSISSKMVSPPAKP